MWFIFDALGVGLSLLTWLLIGFVDWVVYRFVFLTWFATVQSRFQWLPLTVEGVVLLAIYQMLLGLCCFSHLQAMLTDPGTIAQKDAPAGMDKPRFCKLCDGKWKPPRAHHCKTCHRCIFRMDHHCPWINNCVGLSNQKLFVLFLGYTALSAIVSLLLLISSALYWLWSQNSWSDAAPPGSLALICSGVAAVTCFAAVLFVVDFLQEQIESISTNSTLVETYQRTHGVRTTFRDHFQIVFGDKWYLWMWPFPSASAPKYEEIAVPDDDAISVFQNVDDGGTLGIAGHDTEDFVVSEASDLHRRPPMEGGDLRQRQQQHQQPPR